MGFVGKKIQRNPVEFKLGLQTARYFPDDTELALGMTKTKQNTHTPCWNCTTSYKFSVSAKKMGEGCIGGASDIGARGKRVGFIP